MSTNQLLAKVLWPPHVQGMSPSKFREALAKSELFDQTFFHYTNSKEVLTPSVGGKDEKSNRTKVVKHYERAVPDDGRPPIRIVGSMRWGGVVFDESKHDYFYTALPNILKVASDIAGQPVKLNVEQHQLRIRYTDTPIRYMLREMAIYRRSAASKAMSTEDLVSSRLFGGFEGNLQGLDGICMQYGLELPDARTLDLKVNVLREFGVPLRSSDGLSKEYFTVVSGEVWMNAILGGVWQVGNLTSRGYGQIIRKKQRGEGES